MFCCFSSAQEQLVTFNFDVIGYGKYEGVANQ